MLIKEILSKSKRLHLVGIGGIGMSGLAILLKESGFCVQGSDIKESENTKILKEKGIKVFIGHSSENITSQEVLILSSAIKSDNSEVLEAKKRGIPLLRRSQVLNYLVEDKKTICVCGAHGKTTVSGMCSFLLKNVLKRVSWFVGGRFRNSLLHARKEDFEYFIVETDESDGSFLDFHPYITICTNIDKEHLNFYGSFDNLKKKFLEFFSRTKYKNIICLDNRYLRENLSQIPKKFTYGFSKDADLRADVVDLKTSRFKVFLNRKYIEEFKIKLFGLHNILNSLACICVGVILGLDSKEIKKVLSKFEGIKRRLELKYNLKDILFFDDYAHHPQEIKESLKALKLFSPNRLICVFQPHRYSRFSILFKEFLDSFDGVDFLIITDIYPAQEQNIYQVNILDFYKEMKKRFKNRVKYLHLEEIPKFLKDFLKPKDLLVSLGAGNVNKVLEETYSLLNENNKKL